MIHLFTGPTLPKTEIQSVLDGDSVCIHPPVKHGDFFNLSIAEDDTILIVDGLYHHTPALRHKEILAVMKAGVRVAGTASIGALRAAELEDYGMIGIGEIFRMYKSQEITDDAEVAVAQQPDGEMNSLSWPMVNLRYALKMALKDGCIDTESSSMLIREFNSVYYPQRTFYAVRSICKRQKATKFLDWFDNNVSQDKNFANLKRIDAWSAIKSVIAGDLSFSKADWELPSTTYYRRWSNYFASDSLGSQEIPLRHRIAYQQIFHPSFHILWDEFVKRTIGASRNPLLSRVIPDLRNPDTVKFLLSYETDENRDSLIRFAESNERAATQVSGFTYDMIKTSTAENILCKAWNCSPDDLSNLAVMRGFMNLENATSAAKYFVSGLVERAR